MKFTDDTVLSWGKYQGYKLANVPAGYLLWIYDNLNIHPGLKNYIDNNRKGLEQEVKQAVKEKKR